MGFLPHERQFRESQKHWEREVAKTLHKESLYFDIVWSSK
jgi:hypothetical protein